MTPQVPDVFQDHYADDVAHCYGCGRKNPHGHHIQTLWEGEETVTRFTPEPYHTAIPGYVYGGLIHAVFIRAPIIESVSGDARVLASIPDGRIVAAQQGHLLATSFHPELTNDTRFHEYFLSLVD